MLGFNEIDHDYKEGLEDEEQDFDEVEWGDCLAPADDEPEKGAEAKPKAKETDTISDATARDYISSLENLQRNGSTTSETVDAFKKAVGAIKKFDQKELEKELDAAAKNPKVHSIYVAMHLKEMLEKSGWTNISSQLQPKEGSIVMKNPKTETYIQMQYSTERGKAGASVSIENKR